MHIVRAEAVRDIALSTVHICSHPWIIPFIASGWCSLYLSREHFISIGLQLLSMNKVVVYMPVSSNGESLENCNYCDNHVLGGLKD